MAARSRATPYRLLARSQLPSDPVALARALIGRTLVHDTSEGRRVGRIVETEAYHPQDAASHAFRGPSPRNRSMYLRKGHAYVYFIYGAWYALNVVAGRVGFGAAVLIRALEPLEGIALMQRRRPHAPVEDLARGPGKLATVFDIDRRYDGLDLCARGPLWLAQPTRPRKAIAVSTRIGITKDAHRPWRFFEKGNPCVSRWRPEARR